MTQVPEQLRTGWRFVTVHLNFFRPIPLQELDPTTDEGKAFDRDMGLAWEDIHSLGDEALAKATPIWEKELDQEQASISETRSRAAQLLSVTGVVAVLAGLGNATQNSVELVPTQGTAQVLTLVLAAMTAYALLGTLWLTVQALAVRSWDRLDEKPTKQMTPRRALEAHAYQVYLVRHKLAVRLSRPVGYLRDAYGFFFVTVVLICIIIGVRIVATAIASAPT
jgi:hypothetical protein